MKYSILISFLVIFLGCQSKEDINPEYRDLLVECNLKDTGQNLDWLNQIIKDLDSNPGGYRIVKLVQYDSTPYVLVEAIWKSTPGSIYDCRGLDITGKSEMSYSDFKSRTKTIKVLYEKQ
ncbi:hypothetical protein ACFSKL_06990 [Belliella marina]|uniref:Lipoprotein n=1 Tax=Belliella marina TaxID=1644146 RepID=A0ABW4VLE5_9BACT